ncbi:MAG: response regulator [bacterium]|nr:response regulator [bacterium]
MISASDILNSKILIVDDQEANVILLERMLGGAGYVSISSTMEAGRVCELHLGNQYDLILLDLLMPGMNGFQVMEELKKTEKDGYLPVLVISAQPDQKLRALKSGAKDFVSKPFDIAEVLARVHNMLEVRLLYLQTRSLCDQLAAEKKQSFELAAQPGIMVGVEKEERINTHWFRSLRLRHPWLQFNLLTSLAGGGMMLIFQETVSRLLILVVFVPVLISQSSNTGSQALAITLRGLALGELKAGREKALIMKEALLGLLNGTFVGLVAAIAMYVAATVQHSPIALMLGAIVFLAMTGSCIISGICGAMVPLVLKKLGADPASASSIVLTTTTDVASLVMLLGLATILVK